MQTIKEEIIYWAKRLYDKGLSPATTGNISVKTERGILITASGSAMGDLTPDEIVLIDFEGNLLEGNKKASSEKFLHLDIYQEREDISTIIHSHCPYITAFAVADQPVEAPILAEFIYHFDKVPLAPYVVPSSFKLAEVTVKPFKKGYSTVLMGNHGVVTGAATLKECFYNLEALRAYCETYFGACVLGGAKKLNKQEVEEIRKLKSGN